jgi:two-component system, sensor histidine kinase PdtaS
MDRAIPLGLIVNELVTNAYKHGFRPGGAGSIRVRLEPDPAGGWCLEVSDAASSCGGQPATEAPRATAADGIGMQLVQGFARQLGGSVRVECRPRFRVLVDLPWPTEGVDAPAEAPRAVA